MLRTLLTAAALLSTTTLTARAQVTHAHPPVHGHAHTQAHAAIHDSIMKLHGSAHHDSLMARHASIHPDSLAAHHRAMMEFMSKDLAGSWVATFNSGHATGNTMDLTFSRDSVLKASVTFGNQEFKAGPARNVHFSVGRIMWLQPVNDSLCSVSITPAPHHAANVAEVMLSGTLLCGEEKMTFTARKANARR